VALRQSLEECGSVIDDEQQALRDSFNGGSEEDRQRLTRLYHDWLYANGHLDRDLLATFWSDDPENVFFNNNGYTYHGRDEWLNLWEYLGGRMVEAQPSTPGGVRIIIRGDMAVITEERGVRRWNWFGAGEPRFTPAPYVRSTLVVVRDDGDWKVVHAHFSPGKEGPRPEQRP
jgi:ketosteroid isomerase-like protein